MDNSLFGNINRNVARYVSFTDQELEIFNSLLHFQLVPKKTILLHEGEKCNFEAFVIKGCLRKYYIDPDGTELIIQFGVEDSWIGDISFSIYDPKPSRVFIETLEDSEIFMMSPEDKEELYKRVPKFERVFRILMQRNLAVTQDRLFAAVSKNATEKYLEFLQHYPGLPQRVPQHYIASYLGISPEFLSKVRKKLSQAH